MAFGTVHQQLAIGLPTQPAVAGVDNYTGLAQALEPCAQQRRGFHIGGEHPAGTADKGFDPQLMNPLAQRIGIEGAQQRCHLRCAFGVARQESRVGFGMGDIHAADPGQQKLAAHRRHAIVEIDLHPSLTQHFGGHQTGGATANNGDVTGRECGGFSHGRAANRRNRPGILPDWAEQIPCSSSLRPSAAATEIAMAVRKTYSLLEAMFSVPCRRFHSGYPQAVPQALWVKSHLSDNLMTARPSVHCDAISRGGAPGPCDPCCIRRQSPRPPVCRDPGSGASRSRHGPPHLHR